MSTDTKQGQSVLRVQVPEAVIGARHFVLHFIEMCLVMCIGGIALIVLAFTAAGAIGYPDLISRYPEASVLAIGFILTVPMIAWMRFRGMSWRLTLEMAVTSAILGSVLAGLGWLGVLSRGSLTQWLTRLTCHLMLIPMLLRLDHYAGRGGHAMHAHHHH